MVPDLELREHVCYPRRGRASSLLPCPTGPPPSEADLRHCPQGRGGVPSAALPSGPGWCPICSTALRAGGVSLGRGRVPLPAFGASTVCRPLHSPGSCCWPLPHGFCELRAPPPSSPLTPTTTCRLAELLQVHPCAAPLLPAGPLGSAHVSLGASLQVSWLPPSIVGNSFRVLRLNDL